MFHKISAVRSALALLFIGAAVSAAAPASAADVAMDDVGDLSAASAAPGNDAGFSSLFSTWKKMDGPVRSTVSIPTRKPVEDLTLTSNFGERSDPFNGHRRFHAGIDIPGPVGTPIYATADGIVSRAGRAGGYGNLVEISHGDGIATRYGHMSKFIVAENETVHRGQVIGYMGSTGRSTGSHLHYEVRIDGQAVNPMPFVQNGDYILALNTKPPVAMGGPEEEE